MVFCRRLSAGSTIERGMFMYESFFAGVYRSVRLNCSIPFCVFRTRNVYVLVVFRRRLSLGWTKMFYFLLSLERGMFKVMY